MAMFLVRAYVGVMLAALVFTAGGCSSAAPSTATSAPAAPTSPPSAPTSALAAPRPASAGGQVVAAMQYDNSDMDPGTLSSVTDQQEAGSLYDGLVRYKLGSTDIEPALAEGWETSGDGTKLTFHLRSGAKFHDGSPLQSSDVKFTIDRIKDPSTKSSWPACTRQSLRSTPPTIGPSSST